MASHSIPGSLHERNGIQRFHRQVSSFKKRLYALMSESEDIEEEVMEESLCDSEAQHSP